MSYSIYFTAGLVSFLTALILVITKKWHGRFTLDGLDGVQKVHQNPTPRVGGIAIAIGLIFIWGQSEEPFKWQLGLILIAAVPAFLFGVAEDLTRKVGVRERLIATMFSGVLAYTLTGISLTRIDVIGFDYLLGFLPISILFTAFAVGGVANSINIIDGFHGLSGFTSLIILASIGAVANTVGDLYIYHLCWALASTITGFLLLNYPSGKIFLGDGGAYLIGFAIAWIALLLSERNIDISPWVGLLACAYPIIEVIYSMYRRKKNHTITGHPDLLHFHSLVKFRFIRKYWGGWTSGAQNAFVVFWTSLFTVIPAYWAYFFYKDTPILIIGFIVSFIIYINIYLFLESQPDQSILGRDT